MAKEDKETAETKIGVVEKMRAYKDSQSGTHTLDPLPMTGVVVSFPKFLNHGVWQRHMRRAKGDVAAAQIAYVCSVASFDGEKITPAHWEEFIPLADANEILAAIFAGVDGDEDEAGNGETLN
ncbi:MAG: hypothetical protein AAFN43_10635 [Pseudomonadota bacterium]